MSYSNILPGARIEYLGRSCRYERRQDHITEWRASNFEHFAFTDAELQKEIRLGNVRLWNGGGREPREASKSSKIHGQRGPTFADRAEAERKLVFVIAVHDNDLLRSSATPDDWQAVIDNIWTSQQHFWTRLRGRRAGEPCSKPSLRSVRRWVAEAGPRPTINNLIPRHRHKGNYDDRLPTDLRNLIGQMVDEFYLARPAITLEDLKVRIHGRIEEENPKRREDGLPPLPFPGLSALQSSIDALPQDQVLRARHGDMAAFLKYGSAIAQPDPRAPLDRVELDSTPADLFVIDAETGLPIGRPEIVVCIDRCTRMVLGWFVTFEKPSVHALMQCLRNVMLSKDYIAEMNALHGWNIRHEAETFGVPRTLVLDRARENISVQVAHFAVRAGVNRVILLGGKKPWLKGAVERVIKTMSEALLHPAKGTTFHNVLERMGYKPDKDAVCTIEDLDEGLHKYFVDIYPREPRRSLSNRRAIDVWRELTRRYPVESVGSIEDVAHLYGRTEFAKPTRAGISFANMQYVSRELVGLLSNSTFRKAMPDGKVEFHLNPADLGQIHVRLPHVEKIITVPVAPRWTKYATGLSLWHHRKIREYATAQARDANDADQLLLCKLDLIEIMRGKARGKRRGLGYAKIIARMEGVNRMARAGTDASSTVAGCDAHDRRYRRNDMSPGAANDGECSMAPSVEESGAPGEPEFADAFADPDALSIADAALPARRAKRGYRP